MFFFPLHQTVSYAIQKNIRNTFIDTKITEDSTLLLVKIYLKIQTSNSSIKIISYEIFDVHKIEIFQKKKKTTHNRVAIRHMEMLKVTCTKPRRKDIFVAETSKFICCGFRDTSSICVG